MPIGGALERAAGAHDLPFAELLADELRGDRQARAVKAAGKVSVGWPDMSNGAV